MQRMETFEDVDRVRLEMLRYQNMLEVHYHDPPSGPDLHEDLKILEAFFENGGTADAAFDLFHLG